MSNQLAAAVRFLLATSGPKTGQQYECWKSLKEALAAHEAAKPAPDRVPMPQNADQAVGMVSLGIAWLKGHAPERLAAPWRWLSQWQPIETAPKDGSLLLLKEKWEDEPFIGQWVNSAYGDKWAASRTHYDTDGNACVIDRVYSEGVTHWQPLPPAPKEQQHE